ncbi:Mrp/NBP35 family ATP-binding protein [Acidobacteria bacterium AH-259-G07]|nr:Mrp/NBP35 family ATP-binding protein [Acidobacteria bacterium AH-259-G07]
MQDPDLGRDIVSLGFVKEVKLCAGVAAVTIELTTPACPVKDQMREQAKQAILALPGIEEANVQMTAQVRPSSSQARSFLPGVKNVLPVGSGKGGVGKSTVSANLAVALAQSGAEVGLMDADVYGPSIPTLMGISGKPTVDVNNQIIPITQYDLKVISMGFFLPQEKAVIWRGPMLDKMMVQFLGGVQWGELDYLIIDLPPGTGDIQLSLCQKVSLTGAVVVSTPQDVALNVAQKAIAMFEQLNTPVLGLIENMSYYVCSHCGHRDEIFGNGGARQVSERRQLPFLGDIPLSTDIRKHSDQGKPVVLADPESERAKAFVRVAENLAAQISIHNMSGELGQDIKVSF